MIVSKRIALAVGGVAAAAVLGTAGIAAAAGSPTGGAQPITAVSTAAPSPSAGADAKDRRAHHPRLAKLARGLHGEFVAKGKDGKIITIVTVKGQVTAVSPTSVTFKAEDGYTATFTIGADSKVRGKDVDAIGDVKVGDSGGAVGVKGADGITARTVLVREK